MHEGLEGRLTIIVGQGYVGLPLAMAACRAGRTVLGIDTNLDRVAEISTGRSPTGDVSSEELQREMRRGRYSITSSDESASGFEFAIITVPTPLSDGKPDLSFIKQAAASLATRIAPGATVILESTTYPGTSEELLVPILEEGSGLTAGQDFFVGYSPERIDPGNSEWGLQNTPKVTSGINAASAERVEYFYQSLGIPTVPVSGTREAELTKLLENTFRHVNIALVNELAVFASAMNVDIWESIHAASSKPFGFMKFTPGPGVGGHCLPVDPSYLSWAIERASGESFEFVTLANKVNASMPTHVVQRLESMMRPHGLHGRTILLVGVAYKANTGDARESPATQIGNALQLRGARVVAHDPFVSALSWPTTIKRVPSLDTRGIDAAVVVTAHSEIDLSELLSANIPIFDTQNVLSGSLVEVL